MSRQRDRFYGSAKSGANSNELLPLRVDPDKPTTPFSQKISSKEEIPKISSAIVTQSQLISTPVPTPTMPVQSHSLPSDINKKRSSDMHRESYPPDKASKKKSKPNTKRRASVSNELHDEKSTRKGLMQEGFHGTFQTSTNFDNGDRDGHDAPKDFAAIDGDRKRSLQEHQLGLRIASLGLPPDGNQQMRLKRNVGPSHLKHEAENIDSDAHPGPSSPSSYEDVSIEIIEEDDGVLGDDTSQSGQFANHTGQKANRTVSSASNELGSGIGSVYGDQTTNVIDVDAKRTGTEKNYSSPALYIAELATWEIPKTTIPIDPKAVSDWENKGQELAQRAAQLMEAHISHRRDRSDLFQRVRNRVDNHKTYLQDRNKALTNKLTTVSNQCQSLIEEVKTGTV